MGKMKELYTEIEEALTKGDWMELTDILDRLDESVRAEWLLGTVQIMSQAMAQGYKSPSQIRGEK